MQQSHNIGAELFIMSSSALIDSICFHQRHDTVLVKRAMFELRALHAPKHPGFIHTSLRVTGVLSGVQSTFQ